MHRGSSGWGISTTADPSHLLKLAPMLVRFRSLDYIGRDLTYLEVITRAYARNSGKEAYVVPSLSLLLR